MVAFVANKFHRMFHWNILELKISHLLSQGQNNPFFSLRDNFRVHRVFHMAEIFHIVFTGISHAFHRVSPSSSKNPHYITSVTCLFSIVLYTPACLQKNKFHIHVLSIQEFSWEGHYGLIVSLHEWKLSLHMNNLNHWVSHKNKRWTITCVIHSCWGCIPSQLQYYT